MLRCRLVWGGNGVTGASVSTFYFSGTLQAEADAAVAALATWGQGVMADVCGASTTVHVESSVDIVDPATGNVTGQLVTTPPGQSVGPSSSIVSKASQALVNWRTDNFQGGRRVAGRTFIPAVKTSAIDTTGNLTTLVANSVTSRSTTLINTTGADLTIYSRRWAIQPAATSAQCPLKLAVLRSRRD